MVDEKNIFDVMKQPTVTILEELSKMDTLDVDCKNEVGQSPLHLAVLNNQLSVAAYLLNKGFSPNKKDENLLPPFIAAAANGCRSSSQSRDAHGYADGGGAYRGRSRTGASARYLG